VPGTHILVLLLSTEDRYTPHLSGVSLHDHNRADITRTAVLVMCRAGLGSSAPAWARLGRARAHENLEPGPG